MTFGGAGEASVGPNEAHLAHLVEHVWFRAGDHEARIHALGCQFQALTWPRTMDFFVSCPADQLEAHLDLEASRLTGEFTGLDEAEVAVERDVVALEVAAYRESRELVVGRAIAAYLDPSAHVRRRLSTRGLGDELDLAAVRRFAIQHLRPERAVLAIVSPVPDDALRSKLEARFGPIVSTEPRGPIPVRPERRKTLRVDVREIEATIERPAVAVSWELPDALRPTAALNEALEQALVPRLAVDSRFEGLDCEPNPAVPIPVVTCVMALREDADAGTVARALRQRLDIAQTLARSLGPRGLVEDRDDRWVDAWLAYEDLEAGPYSRAAWLAQMMLRFNGLGRASERDLSKKQRRALLAALEEAFDPQRAVFLAVMPGSADGPLPVARDVGALDAPFPDLLPSPEPVTEAAPIKAVPGGIAVVRPDFSLTHALRYAKAAVQDWSVWLGGGPLASPDDRQVVYLGPKWPVDPTQTPAAYTLGSAEPDAEDDEPGAGLVVLDWSCNAPDGTPPAVLLVAREVLAHRAFHELRARRAWTYDPAVTLRGDTLGLRVETLPDAKPQVVVDALLAALAAGRFAEHEIDVAKRRASVTGSTASALPSDWERLFSVTRDAAELNDLPKAIRSLQPQTVAMFFAHCSPSVSGDPSETQRPELQTEPTSP